MPSQLPRLPGRANNLLTTGGPGSTNCSSSTPHQLSFVSPSSSRSLSFQSNSTSRATNLQTFFKQPRSQIANMSTTIMPATGGHNEACCNIPPVVASGYTPKGSYEQLGGLKTYVTGPAEATKGLVMIYDAFAYVEQTLQGADILAASDARKYKVFMPDWFKGDPISAELFPPDTEEKQHKPEHRPHTVAAALPDYVKALRKANPHIQELGIVGFCWGGKVVSLVTSAETNPFTIAAVAHPAMVDPSEADKISVPYILLASQEEPVDTVKEFQDNLRVSNHVEMFSDQVHGWMAARGDLSNPRVREQYIRGYRTILQFFREHWGS
ncbi:Alpha/Beta hydrolase protein [Apodospora peruviana]|uniref:Alpha/Beta hydrolase protein n=1 Tax=Apodospora peruviana TaxID=516989 RepID=A0AAE0I5H1_9PEZI|nr:Alpha/Beta hydrolase protein [Apodospora peruviana]